MQIPSIRELDEIRKTGFRPQVVACFLNDNKVLFLYKKEYNLWQLPQGGVDNGETIEEAVNREMKEELGEDFVSDLKMDELIRRNAIEFPPDKWGSRELITDAGEKILMKGKEYFFVVVNSSGTDLDIDQTEFEDYQWASYNQALEVTKKIYQNGKRRITEDVLSKLHELELL